MAWRLPWRRRGRTDARRDDQRTPGAPERDTIDLAGEENRWWSQREVVRPWEPRRTEEPGPADQHPEADRRDDPAPAPAGTRDQTRAEPETPQPPETPSPLETAVPETPVPRRGRATDPPAQSSFIDELPDIDSADPYAVLGIATTATWDQILDAHRALARRYHPDKVATFDDVSRAHAEEIMFKINSAYRDLKVRRGR